MAIQIDLACVLFGPASLTLPTHSGPDTRQRNISYSFPISPPNCYKLACKTFRKMLDGIEKEG
jgi:hypothetical protein